MVNLAVPISGLARGISPRDPQLPLFTESLSLSQRYPCVLVVMGVTLTVVSGVAGLVAGLGGVQ
ncbi:MAG: hypothetical protein H0T78_04165 [Longispora sp.]|nr:hypothetical protein [Longispora sp. (in: high G+C Gram-positive bacteria)]